MGLDTFAAPSPDGELSEDDKAAFAAADVQLCGGIWSGDAGSFRGKVYAELVEQVTGESLYRTWIPPETVRAMATSFAACDPDAVRDGLGAADAPTAAEIRSLGEFFAVCAERGLGLVGWW
jgi:hypothetical protein